MAVPLGPRESGGEGSVEFAALSGVETSEASGSPLNPGLTPQNIGVVLDAAGSESVEIPGGSFFQSAEYVREGPDLLLIGTDGQTVLVRDYFANEVPPDLTSDLGGRIADDVAARLAGSASPGQVAQAQAIGSAEAIGRVDTLDGDVFATRLDGTRIALGTGDPIFQGDVLQTGAGAAVGVVFVDDTTFALGEGVRMAINELVWDPDSNEGTAVFSMIQGGFTFVSGLISKAGPDQLVVNSPVVTVGVRGAAFTMDGVQVGRDNNMALLAETLPDGTTFVGEVVAFNDAASISFNADRASAQVSSYTAPLIDTGILSVQQVATTFPTISFVPAQFALPIQNDPQAQPAAPADTPNESGDAATGEGTPSPTGETGGEEGQGQEGVLEDGEPTGDDDAAGEGEPEPVPDEAAIQEARAAGEAAAEQAFAAALDEGLSPEQAAQRAGDTADAAAGEALEALGISLEGLGPEGPGGDFGIEGDAAQAAFEAGAQAGADAFAAALAQGLSPQEAARLAAADAETASSSIFAELGISPEGFGLGEPGFGPEGGDPFGPGFGPGFGPDFGPDIGFGFGPDPFGPGPDGPFGFGPDPFGPDGIDGFFGLESFDFDFIDFSEFEEFAGEFDGVEDPFLEFFDFEQIDPSIFDQTFFDTSNVQLSIGGVSVSEGGGIATFTVFRSGDFSGTATVDFATADGTAVAGSDYTAISGILTFAAGVSTQQISVAIIDDSDVESAETFFVDIFNASGATILDLQGIGTITDNDTSGGSASLSINDVTVAEAGGSAVFTVTRSGDTSGTATVDVSTADNTATAPGDFTAIPAASPQTLTFAPGVTTQQVSVTIVDDSDVESTETFFVNLTNSSGATVSDSQGIGTITDNDPAGPTISIDDPSVSESDSSASLEFKITLSSSSATTVTVTFSTSDDTTPDADQATGGPSFTPPTDYIEVTSQTVTFNPGDTEESVFVSIVGDTTTEPNETFFGNLSGVSSNATIADNQGTGTILNDDSFFIGDATADEDAGTITFTVTRSGQPTTPATVDFATPDGTAIAGLDYLATSGTLAFAPGITERIITVTVLNDAVFESAETFTINLSNAVGDNIKDGEGIGTIAGNDLATALAAVASIRTVSPPRHP